ncbi:MAG TPA: DUF423 domain-containing protein [Longimicrobiales bacterium]|nr:DUF423 domain-containing protein [Longimicrobiales bacterium]
MDRTFALWGAIFALIAVALGAFGAHALESRVEPRDLEIWETAVRYQMWHALALIVLAALHTRWPGGGMVFAGWSFVAGIVVFSGSLYALVGTGIRGLGAITPIGGLAFLIGWAALIQCIVAD